MSVLVFAENWDGKFKKLSFELVSYASRLSEMIKGQVHVLTIGTVADEELKQLGTYGADKVWKTETAQPDFLDNQVYTSLIAGAAEQLDASVVLLSHNNAGKALAPRLSVRLGAALGAAVLDLPESTDPFIVRKKVFNGHAFARVALNSKVRILTLAQNSFGLAVNGKQAETGELSLNVNDNQSNIRLLDVEKQTGKVILSDAEVVVSGGRGMKSPENWGPIEELAGVLGGATACSRPVSDEGWRPHSEHTGQTGKVISPGLYIAAGISGAIQHMAGVSGSKCIVAINKDPDAPVFEMADYGIVGDALQVLPDFIRAVKELKGA